MEEALEAEQARAQQEAQRAEIVQRICAPAALERLMRVKMVKKDLVEKVERFLEQQARGGKLRQQITEAQVVDLLTQIGNQNVEQKIVINRKRNGYGSDGDDDDDSDLM